MQTLFGNEKFFSNAVIISLCGVPIGCKMNDNEKANNYPYWVFYFSLHLRLSDRRWYKQNSQLSYGKSAFKKFNLVVGKWQQPINIVC